MLASLPVMRGDWAYWSGKTTSCAAPSPLIKVTCTIWPCAAVKHRVDLALDGAADADKDHLSFGDARTQRVPHVGHVGHPMRHRRRRAVVAADWAGGVTRAAPAGCPGGRCLRRCRRLTGGRGGGAARLGEQGDHVVAVVCRFQTGKRHTVARHELLRVGEIAGQGLRVPDDVGLLHRRRVVEPGTVPAFRPMIPAKLGPIRFRPASSEWHDWHLR